MNDLKKKITLKLSSLGFDVIGITKPEIDDNVGKKYDQFLKKNFMVICNGWNITEKKKKIL